jgi:hypothetical protein
VAATGRHIQLLLLVNDISLRSLNPGELGKVFSAFRAKPSTDFSPANVTSGGDAGPTSALANGGVARNWYTEDLRAASPVVHNPALMVAFAKISRENYLGKGPWGIHLQLFNRPTYNSSTAEPHHIYHDVLVSIDHDRHHCRTGDAQRSRSRLRNKRKPRQTS